MDAEEGTSNGGGTECSEALQCLKSDEVVIGIREMDVEEGTSNGGDTECSEALQCLKSGEDNNGIREMDVEEGTSNGGSAEFLEAVQCLKSEVVNNEISKVDVEEGKNTVGGAELSEVPQCLKSDEVGNGIRIGVGDDIVGSSSGLRSDEVNNGIRFGVQADIAGSSSGLKSDGVNNGIKFRKEADVEGIREMDVEEGTSSGGSAEFLEAVQCLESEVVNNEITEVDVEEGKNTVGGAELSEVLQCLKSDEVGNGIRIGVDDDIVGSSSGLRSDEVNNGIRFGVQADVAGSSSGLKSDGVNNGIKFGKEADVEGSSLGMKSEEVNNGIVFGFRAGVSRQSSGHSSGHSEGFQTYKRRKHVNSSNKSVLEDDGRAYAKGASQLVHQPIKDTQGVVLDNGSCEQICLPTDSLDGCSQKPWKIVLECMYQSLSDNDGGIQGSIRDVLESYPGMGSTKRAKEYDHRDENRWRCPSPTRHPLNGFQKEASGHPGVLSNGNLDSLSHDTVTDVCRHVFLNILLSENFASLCKLLLDNFQGIKIDSFFDLNLINSRVKDGVYDNSPVLFLTDIQQVWEKLEGVGAEMISLAKNLSDISRSCYNKQFCTWESDSHTKLEKGEGYSAYKACTCSQCGLKADGRDYLVCDSCEEMYHVSCIEPAVKEIPPKSWYCATCIANGIQSPHENCVVCERLNAPKTAVKVDYDSSYTNEETLNELGESSDCGTDEEGFQPSKRSENLGQCKICGCEIQDGEESKICSNNGCPGGCYHVRCLSKKQLKSYSPCWYCPSCLCRICLADKDDDKIVLCDGCDHAYHIYCMKPARSTIPKGKWFCVPCQAQRDAVRKAKRKFENRENKQRKKANKGLGAFANLENRWNSEGIMESDKGGGAMEMLISAADTLNNEEKLAGILDRSCKKISG
ncbi:uncharacterized protein LOC112093355 isoform X2 [Morus notabilis]|uniref:uncharacterized protein LOC112093355 isoform X2 n=1 Tax=Morus notabilis TaxID=981085 RepID=UPI000CED3019|nr:uncharacterized protein LOC112093355 isoform X2 [Morus notabilis]